MIRDYTFYRKRAGLDFDKFIELNPEKDGEGLFQTFMKRYDCYYKQRDMVVEKFNRRMLDEQDETNIYRIGAEKMYAIAQIEQVFIDVMRVIFGLAPDDENAKFGDTIDSRYDTFIKDYIDPEKPGFYKGADGLYRIRYFYEDDIISLRVMKEYYKHAEIMYHYNEGEEDQGRIQMLIDGKEVKLSDMAKRNPIKFIEKLIDLNEQTELMTDEEIDEHFKDKEDEKSNS